MRIAFCITELEPGGAERCLVELASRLDRQQFDPVVYCLAPRPADNPTSLADTLERAGVRVSFFGARRTVQLPAVLQRLRRQLAADSPQILQSFLFHANVLGTVAGWRARVPHIVTGIRVAERRGGWHVALARWTDRWVERHVCVSRSVRDFCVQVGLPAEKLVVIPNGVDVERFVRAKACAPDRLGVAPGRRVIVFVGRLDPQKGLGWLLGQMPRVFDRLPLHDLVLVGSGPERARLEKIVARLAITDRVHFLGFRDDVPEILAAGDLLMLPSRWEGMPNVVLEAMASGKPVVATDVEGVAECLGPEAAAQTVPPEHADAFINKVVAIVGNPSLAARLGSENERRAREVFGLGAMVRSYERLYGALLDGRQ